MVKIEPYASGVLRRDVHERLVADIDSYAHDAGIKPACIWTPLAETCGEDEIDYARRFNKHRAEGKVAGLVYTGSNKMIEADLRMSALAGCLLRNFIRAQVRTVGQVVEGLKDGNEYDVSALLIPNLFLPKAEAGHLSPWQVSAVLDLLLTRQKVGLQTIVYVSDFVNLSKEYGVHFKTLFETHYQRVQL